MRKSHGESKTRLFSIWQRVRGEDKFDPWGRHAMPDAWRDNFLAFKAWAYEAGYADNLVLKRKDRYKAYGPDNCYWDTRYSNKQTGSDSLVNRTFGKLVVLREVPKPDRKSGRRAYVCRCECGNETVVQSNNLLSGATKSCGCLRNKARSFAVTSTGDIRVGRLTILDKYEENGIVYRRCLCDCGKMLGVPVESLMDGSVKSCGCSVTVHEPTTPTPEPVPQQPATSERIDIDALLKALDEQPPTSPNPFDGWDNF